VTGAVDLLESWQPVPALFRASTGPLPAPWEDLLGPLRVGRVDDLVVVAQIGQSLDGRIATITGDSHYINQPAGLAHLHRLRAVVDAVIVGIGTALSDDPQLTVRRVVGPHPARVVLDPRGRLSACARLLNGDGARRVVVTAQGTPCALSDVEVLSLPAADGHIADTISRFLAARCLDRLHVVVAPVILGAGRPSINLDPIDRMDEALRPPMHVHWLDGEVLFDCDLSSQRVPVGCAKKST
jgi:riboflavin biosynthesis pyrimidine reductase